jgi:hypothetical protein
MIPKAHVMKSWFTAGGAMQKGVETLEVGSRDGKVSNWSQTIWNLHEFMSLYVVCPTLVK